jgi:hypothetical protein
MILVICENKPIIFFSIQRRHLYLLPTRIAIFSLYETPNNTTTLISNVDGFEDDNNFSRFVGEYISWHSRTGKISVLIIWQRKTCNIKYAVAIISLFQCFLALGLKMGIHFLLVAVSLNQTFSIPIRC